MGKQVAVAAAVAAADVSSVVAGAAAVGAPATMARNGASGLGRAVVVEAATLGVTPVAVEAREVAVAVVPQCRPSRT